MALPNFLIVGAMKAGTTSLSDALSNHPEVFIPASKEPGSLLRPSILTADGLAAYRALFERGADMPSRGEASTEYTKWDHGSEQAVAHAKQLLGDDLKLIYLVRDPIDRAVSHAKHLIISDRPFDREEVIGPDSELCEVGCYHFQIEPWLRAFGRDQLLTIDMQDMITNWDTVSLRICEHLGIEPSRIPPLGQANASSDARPPRGLLATVLASDLYRGAIQERLPFSVRRSLRKVMVRRVPTPPLHRDELRWSDEALSRLVEEVKRFTELTGTHVSAPHLERASAWRVPPTD